ncbi:MAG: EAL domain-containing protein [Moritella sp.]|uniref:putative bifunctional diguanylate cyclase/phosphodiesterase n=1 Tax=Moritella sp. TaxID=78556 RepID=UPI0029AF49C1|nr:EAL domain-containing protein [Moritella sp.]MDX2319383.1 EAL domain-containing protein [Moritella sp.]
MPNKCNITTSDDALVAYSAHLDHVLLQLTVIDWCSRDEFILFFDRLIETTINALNLVDINIHLFTDHIADLIPLLPQYLTSIEPVDVFSPAELTQLQLRSELVQKSDSFEGASIVKLVLPLFKGDDCIGGINFNGLVDIDAHSITLRAFCRSIATLIQRNLRLMGNELRCELSMATANQSQGDYYRLAFFDSLTGLANRRLLNQTIEAQFELAKNNQVIGAILFIDLDFFKAINDSLGHAVGDGILVEVAKRLQEIPRQEDFIARLGGDEFVVLLYDLSENPMHAEQHANLLAEQLIERISEPYLYKGQALYIGASIGITLFPSKDQRADDLLKQADTAMYHAKSNGRKKVSFFDVKMQRKADKRLHIYNCLKSAIANNELFLHYQPQHMVQSGEIIGVEALVRWHLGGKKLISPDEFIPIAEETDLIIDIGIWVLQAACRQFVEWQSDGIAVPQLSVNVSTRQFHDQNFVDSVLMVLNETGMDPMQLNLEITESVVIEHAEDAIRKMTELKYIGVSFAVDDFGAGYSSLSYLKRLPASELKIDRSFIQDIPYNVSDMAIVEAVLAMAKHMDFNVTAEGVESRQQLEFLQRQQCSFYQGFYASKPLTAELLALYVKRLQG